MSSRTRNFAGSVALRGGTALRKLVFGSTGRFSEDMDFVTLTDDNDRIQTDLIGLLVDEDAAVRDGVRVLEFDFEQSMHGTVQATCEFQSERGPGRFELDITGGEGRKPLLGTTAQPPLQQSYLGQLGFAPSPIRRLETIEMIAEKLVSVHRRFENRNPKDVWDLWKWMQLSAANAEMPHVARLWRVRLWLDGQRWRGSGWFKAVEGFAFDWTRLRAMLPPGRGADGKAILLELSRRLAPWIDRDDHQLLEDAGVGRHRAKVIEQLNAVRGAVQDRTA